MAMIFEMMDVCNLYNHIIEDDPFGGNVETWSKGATFEAAIIKDNTTEAIVAEKQGITEIYTVVTKQGFVLDYHNVFKRASDGQFFIVTSKGRDSEAPARSTIKIGKVTAEPWKVPSGVIVNDGNSG